MVQRFFGLALFVAAAQAGHLFPAPAPLLRAAAPLPPFPHLAPGPAPLFAPAPVFRAAPLPPPVFAPAPVFRAAPLPPPAFAPAPVFRDAPLPPPAFAAAPVLHAAPLPPPIFRAAPEFAPAPVVAKTIVDSEYDPNPQYSFGYSVDDALTGDSKAQIETRSGDVVQGSYQLTDSDGTRRIVDYAADPVNGFNAVVRKEPLVGPAPLAFAAPHPPVLAKFH